MVCIGVFSLSYFVCNLLPNIILLFLNLKYWQFLWYTLECQEKKAQCFGTRHSGEHFITIVVTTHLSFGLDCFVLCLNTKYWRFVGHFCKFVSIKKSKAVILVLFRIIDMAMLGGGRFWDNTSFFYSKQFNMSLNLLWRSMHGVGSLTSS